jgi:hypothetical protein
MPLRETKLIGRVLQPMARVELSVVLACLLWAERKRAADLGGPPPALLVAFREYQPLAIP